MQLRTDPVSAIRAHHEELQTLLEDRVEAVIAAARAGRPNRLAVHELMALLTHDIVPHARAEEDVLYAAGTTEPELRRLIESMRFEHETLLALTDELGSVSSGVDAAAIARAIREVFVGHLRRENELLLPALAANPRFGLARMLPVMHETFVLYRAATHDEVAS